jgi:hypothetical protein
MVNEHGWEWHLQAARDCCLIAGSTRVGVGAIDTPKFRYRLNLAGSRLLDGCLTGRPHDH